jgi:cation:H+ antiporter
MPDVLLIVGGLAALIVGAELLVRGGTGLAGWFGIRPMVIGLTVVSLGTSVPELAIGIDAAVTGSPGLAVGNIVGTNLVNVLLVLGLSALLVPVAFERRTLRFDLPAMTAAALALLLLSLNGMLGRAEGLLLLVGGAAYTWALLRISRRDSPATDSETPAGAAGGESTVLAQAEHRPLRDTGSLLAGMALIVLGAELLVEGAVSSAESLGVSEAVIGLTVVALGTSAPELVTTLVSTRRGDRDIAIGNLLGSSIYNIAVVLGLTVMVAPEGVPVPDEVLAADLVLLAVVAVATVPVFVSGARITRAEGALFVATYLGYLSWLLLART